MDVTKQDITAIDMVIVALRKGHFFNIEGDECLALSTHVQRLLALKAKIQKQLSEQQQQQVPQAGQPAGLVVSPPRPVQPLAEEGELKGESQKDAEAS